MYRNSYPFAMTTCMSLMCRFMQKSLLMYWVRHILTIKVTSLLRSNKPRPISDPISEDLLCIRVTSILKILYIQSLHGIYVRKCVDFSLSSQLKVFFLPDLLMDHSIKFHMSGSHTILQLLRLNYNLFSVVSCSLSAHVVRSVSRLLSVYVSCWRQFLVVLPWFHPYVGQFFS